MMMNMAGMKIVAGQRRTFGNGKTDGYAVSLLGIRDLTDKERWDIEIFMENFLEKVAVADLKADPEFPKLLQRKRLEFENAFEKADVKAAFVPCDNEYELKDSVHAAKEPWYQTISHLGLVKVGWRKRVIVLDWSNATPKLPKTAEELFPNENVTKSGKMIHCWGFDKLTEYLKVLSNNL